MRALAARFGDPSWRLPSPYKKGETLSGPTVTVGVLPRPAGNANIGGNRRRVAFSLILYALWPELM